MEDGTKPETLEEARRTENPFFSVHLRDWYLTTFYEDGFGPELDPGPTFGDLADALLKGENVYDLFGDAGDSLVRERLFEELAERTGLDYDAIYGEGTKPRDGMKP